VCVYTHEWTPTGSCVHGAHCRHDGDGARWGALGWRRGTEGTVLVLDALFRLDIGPRVLGEFIDGALRRQVGWMRMAPCGQAADAPIGMDWMA
jgi:hypothetical protein